jgi:L-asparaginase
MSEETIHFIITGGTIDSYYEATKDTAVPNEKSIIPRFVKSLKLFNPVEFTEVCMKDSRDIVQADLKKILNAVEKSPHKKIIITHGTYTMPETGRFLEANLKRKDQTIIVTGSMIPLLGFSPSDGPFALGYSIAKVQELKQGIYICMNGRVFTPKEVMKVNKEGRFTSIFGEK